MDALNATSLCCRWLVFQRSVIHFAREDEESMLFLNQYEFRAHSTFWRVSIGPNDLRHKQE